MTAKAREGLLAFDGSRRAAARYVDGLSPSKLFSPAREVAIADAMRASPAAWRDWVLSGSQQDCSDEIGTLDLPTLVIAGADDPSLGAAVQRSQVLPHFKNARLITVAGGHALPLENPVAVRTHLERFAKGISS
ncbi:hypothetical protein BH09PSE6_BH09PSE6_15550 [soil metagenome]